MRAEEIPVFGMSRMYSWVYLPHYRSFSGIFTVTRERIDELDDVVDDLDGRWYQIRIQYGGYNLGGSRYMIRKPGAVPVGSVIGSVRKAYNACRRNALTNRGFWPASLGLGASNVLCYRIWRARCAWGEGSQLVAQVIRADKQ